MMRRLGRSLRINILIGLLLVTPVAATIVVIQFLVRLATGWMPAVAAPVFAQIEQEWVKRLLVLLFTAVMLYLFGVLTRNFIGRRLYRIGDWLMARIPIVREVYNAVSRIIEALFSQRKTLFKQAVILEYPRKGIYSVAFVTAVLPPSFAHVASGSEATEEWVSLFVPTTPNPTSGVLICAPRSQTVALPMPIPDVMTFVMSAGAVSQREDDGHRSLLDRIEEWLRADLAANRRASATGGDRPPRAPDAPPGAEGGQAGAGSRSPDRETPRSVIRPSASR